MPFSDLDESTVISGAYMRWGITPKRTGKEYHSPCPFCRTGKDRFVIWPNGGYWCRVCNETGFVIDRRRDKILDPIERLKLSNEFAASLADREAEKQAKLLVWQNGPEAARITGWHDAMTEDQRAYWCKEGIPDWAIEYYSLGFLTHKRFMGEGEGAFFTSPAYTIPIRSPLDWKFVNVQYRLLKIPDDSGKYRQEDGIPQASFFTRPSITSGEAIVLEGSKKAIVVFERTGKKHQVVGMPGMTPHSRIFKQLLGFEKIYLALDPGSGYSKAIERAARELHPRVRVMDLPCKPDDAFVKYGLDTSCWNAYMEQARRV